MWGYRRKTNRKTRFLQYATCNNFDKGSRVLLMFRDKRNSNNQIQKMSRNMVSNQENLTNPIEDKLHFPQMQLYHFIKNAATRLLQQNVAGLNWANLFSLKTPGRNFYWKLRRLGKTDLFVCLTNQPLLSLCLPPVMSLNTKKHAWSLLLITWLIIWLFVHDGTFGAKSSTGLRATFFGYFTCFL